MVQLQQEFHDGLQCRIFWIIVLRNKQGKKISKDGARTIDKQVRTKASRLSADFQTMNRGLNQLYLGLQSLKRSEDTLERAEKRLTPAEVPVKKPENEVKKELPEIEVQ